MIAPRWLIAALILVVLVIILVACAPDLDPSNF